MGSRRAQDSLSVKMVCLRPRHPGRGVSPIIATILLVAITVVLASVLYVVVSGLFGGSTGSRPIELGFGTPEIGRSLDGQTVWVNFTVVTSSALTTAEFLLRLMTPQGVGPLASTGICTNSVASCSPGTTWIAFLVGPSGQLLNYMNAGGWENGTTTLNGATGLGFVAAESLGVVGSGSYLQAYSQAQPSVTGQSPAF